MKVFFDTNIYNHLKEDRVSVILNAKDEGEVEIFCNPQILGELAATFNSDIAQGKKIIGMFARLISHRVINQPPVLLINEVEKVLSGKRKSIYLDSTTKRGFYLYIEDFKKGIIDGATRNFVEHTKQKKSDNIRSLKESNKQLAPLWEEHRDRFKTFDSFYEGVVKRGLIREEIKEYLKRIGVPNINKVARKIENKLHDLPHLQTAVKLTAALSYRYEIKSKQPKWGDLEDITIFISLPFVDIFVSDDEGAREMFDLLFPEKKSMNLAQFIDTLKGL